MRSQTKNEGFVSDACFEAMVRHNKRQRTNGGDREVMSRSAAGGMGGGGGGGQVAGIGEPGDLVHGARACAKLIYNDTSNAARKRVYNLWYIRRETKKGPPIFKIGASLVISRSAFEAWLTAQMGG